MPAPILLLPFLLSIVPVYATSATFEAVDSANKKSNATNLNATQPVVAPFDIAAMKCPKVYMYHYDEPALFKGDTQPQSITDEMSFGPVLQPGIYQTNQYETALIFMHRLKRSLHCPITRSPEDADLFLITALSAPKGTGDWCVSCSRNLINNGNAAQFFPFLNESTASRHMVIISKGHYVAAKGAGCGWLRGEFAPFGNVQRFAYSHTFTRSSYSLRAHDSKFTGTWGTQGIKDLVTPPVKDFSLDGRVISIPYPTSVHWTSQLAAGQFWTSAAPRKLLISMFTGFHGKQVALRRKLFRDCQAMGTSVCQASLQFKALPALAVKSNSVFCLEPEGDSPFRKSIYDSLVCGCIPVLFSLDTDLVSPWHWGSFRDDSRILISPDDYMKGVIRLDTLRKISQERVAQMQAVIRANAHKLQYAYDDYPTGDDGFELLLKKAMLRARGVSLADLEAY